MYVSYRLGLRVNAAFMAFMFVGAVAFFADMLWGMVYKILNGGPTYQDFWILAPTIAGIVMMTLLLVIQLLVFYLNVRAKWLYLNRFYLVGAELTVQNVLTRVTRVFNLESVHAIQPHFIWGTSSFRGGEGFVLIGSTGRFCISDILPIWTEIESKCVHAERVPAKYSWWELDPNNNNTKNPRLKRFASYNIGIKRLGTLDRSVAKETRLASVTLPVHTKRLELSKSDPWYQVVEEVARATTCKFNRVCVVTGPRVEVIAHWHGLVELTDTLTAEMTPDEAQVLVASAIGNESPISIVIFVWVMIAVITIVCVAENIIPLVLSHPLPARSDIILSLVVTTFFNALGVYSSKCGSTGGILGDKLAMELVGDKNYVIATLENQGQINRSIATLNKSKCKTYSEDYVNKRVDAIRQLDLRELKNAGGQA